MSRPECTEHLPCRLARPYGPADAELVATPVPSGAEVYRVLVRGEQVGSLQDNGFRAHPTRGGEWVPRWEAFAGGSMVHVTETWTAGVDGGPATRVPGGADRDHALRCLLDYCSRAGFHMRMAMHP